MYEKLLKTVTNLGSPKILLVGDFMLDVYIYGDALRISSEAPVPVLKVTKTEYSCGGAGSVAADLAALGAVPVCLGVIGDDQNGKMLKKMLTETSADITGLLTRGVLPVPPTVILPMLTTAAFARYVFSHLLEYKKLRRQMIIE